MRTFIAITLPRNIQDLLANLQQKLKSSGADVKWVEPNNIHLTLKFLGEIDSRKLNQIAKIIEDTVSDKPVFLARISSIGAFPKISFPRVIWVGMDKGDSEAGEIAEELEKKAAECGIPKEKRPFSAHITIGRMRSNLNRERLSRELEILAKNFAAKHSWEFNVTKIILFKSILTSQGPLYEILKEGILKIN